jgi:transposase-like protein
MSDRSSTGAKARRRLRRMRNRYAPARHREIVALRQRLAELEKEMQESRRLNRRLAELTDVVQELLVPLAMRDEEKVQAYLDRYSSAL